MERFYIQLKLWSSLFSFQLPTIWGITYQFKPLPYFAFCLLMKMVDLCAVRTKVFFLHDNRMLIRCLYNIVYLVLCCGFLFQSFPRCFLLHWIFSLNFSFHPHLRFHVHSFIKKCKIFALHAVDCLTTELTINFFFSIQLHDGWNKLRFHFSLFVFIHPNYLLFFTHFIYEKLFGSGVNKYARITFPTFRFKYS